MKCVVIVIVGKLLLTDAVSLAYNYLIHNYHFEDYLDEIVLLFYLLKKLNYGKKSNS